MAFYTFDPAASLIMALSSSPTALLDFERPHHNRISKQVQAYCLQTFEIG